MVEEDFSEQNSDFESVPGGAELLAWFGYVPSFHDAEIISLHLNRKGESVLTVHTWETATERETDAWPPYIKNVVVSFTLEEITELKLEDFSIQNVIYGLVLRKIANKAPSFNMQRLQPPEPLPDLFEIILEPCYGLWGKIQARRVSITLTPGKPDDTRLKD